jgi:tetratricopeptide (TPR) repeat protein
MRHPIGLGRPSHVADKRQQPGNFTTAPAARRAAARWAVPGLLVSVFLLKLVVVLQLRDHPLTAPDSGLDTTAYVELAQRVVAGDVGLGPGLYYVSPLYIYVLAACLAVFDSFTAVRVVQIVLGTASVWFIFLSARRWFGERAAWIAALLAAFTGLFTFYEVLILQSSIDAFLTSAALWCLSEAFRDSTVASGFSRKSGFSWKFLLAGAIFGLQTLNRPNVLIAAAGVALVMAIAAWRLRPARPELRRGSALLVAGLIAGMAPSAIRNAVVARQFSFVSSHGGLNFFIGNSERATGFYVNVPGITPSIAGQALDARRLAERALVRPLTDAEASAYFFDLGWQWITAHPADAAVLFAKKFYYVFNAAHTALPHSYPFYARDERTALRFYVVGPWLLIPLGLAGLLFVPVRGHRADYLVWVSFVPAYAAAVALFFVAERYRLPLLVPLCIGAGALLSRVPNLQTGTDGVAARWVAGVVVAGLALAANWPLDLSDGRWDEGVRIAQRYANLKQFDAADAWVTRLETSGPPHPGAAHYAVGSQLLLLNEPERARRHLEAAHRADPSRARVEYAYGQALLRTGRAAEAVPHLRRGFDSGEEIPAGGFDLAEALHASGDLRGAAAVVQRIRLADSEPVEAWLRLGRIAHQGREPAIAEPFFRRAVELRPDLASARQQYGLNLLVLGRVADAARELAEAVRLDPRDADSLSSLAYCEMQLGRIADARAHAAAALAINPADPIAGGILRRGGS